MHKSLLRRFETATAYVASLWLSRMIQDDCKLAIYVRSSV